MERKRLYKSASETVNALRARRREQQSGVWKEKREKILSFKRFRFEDKEDSSELNDLTVEEVAVIGKSVQKHGPNVLKDLQRLRKASTQGSEFGDAFITQLDGALEALVRYLTGNDAELQIEAAWCLTNLAGATQQHASRILKATGAYLITYLKGQNVQLVDLCAWTLGNLAGDSEECRRMLRDQGAVDPLLNLLKSTFPNVVQSAAFALGNFACTKEERIFEDLKNGGIGLFLHTLLAASSITPDVMTEVCWILTCFSLTPGNVDYLSSCGINITLIVELLARYLACEDAVQIVTPVLRTIGNICSGHDDYGTNAIRSGVLIKAMPMLLSSSSHHIRKESLWVLSNLTVGSNESLSTVLDAGLLPVVVEMLDGTFVIQKESAIVICNIACNGAEYMKRIVECGGLGKFLQLLKSVDNELTFLALQFFEVMFRTLPESADIFEKADGMSYLEALQYNKNHNVLSAERTLVVHRQMDENLANSEPLDQLETKPEQGVEETSWDCSVCTYKNTSEAFKCLMCDVRKGTSTRKPRLNQQIVAQQVAQQFGPAAVHGKKPGSKKVPRKFRPRLKNVDRNSAQEISVTVGNVTVIITDYKLLQSDDGRILSESLLSNSASDDSLEGSAIMYADMSPQGQVASVET